MYKHYIKAKTWGQLNENKMKENLEKLEVSEQVCNNY